MKQKPTMPTLRPLPGSSGLSSFWNDFKNACNDNTTSCTVGASNNVYDCKGGIIDDEDDDNDSIIDRRQRLQNHNPSTPQSSVPMSHQRVRNIVDGFFSPFVQCVQPPIQACIAPVESWNPADIQCDVRQRRTSTIPKQFVIPNYRNSLSMASENSVTNEQHSTIGKVNINDVLCGRGNGVSRHIGNINFRELIAANKDDYCNLTKKEKMMLAHQIVDLVLYHTDPPGRFVARDTETGLWQDVGIPRSLEKTSQTLREMSSVNNASEKVTCSSRGSLSNVPSFDEADSYLLAKAPTDQHVATMTTSLNRAITIKVRNNRKGLPEPPPIVVPDHLLKVYKREPVQRAICLTSTTNLNTHTTPISTENQYSESRGYVSPTLQQPHLMMPQGPPQLVDYRMYSPSMFPVHISRNSHLAPVPTPKAYSALKEATNNVMRSPARYPEQSQTSIASVLVTPSGEYCKYNDTTPSNNFEICFELPKQALQETPQSQRASFEQMNNYETKTPIFPLDIFQNPKYDREAKFTDVHPQQGDGVLVSPLREQSSSKRQRRSTSILDASFNDSFCVEVDTSLEESVEATFFSDNLNSTSGEIVSSTDTGQTKQYQLAEAIETKLKLNDNRISSPTEIEQACSSRRRLCRRPMEPLQRPPKVTPTSGSILDISADSMDGLAALSTTAFLRLDDSF